VEDSSHDGRNSGSETDDHHPVRRARLLDVLQFGS
jgi:hypothetical protein